MESDKKVAELIDAVKQALQELEKYLEDKKIIEKKKKKDTYYT